MISVDWQRIPGEPEGLLEAKYTLHVAEIVNDVGVIIDIFRYRGNLYSRHDKHFVTEWYEAVTDKGEW